MCVLFSDNSKLEHHFNFDNEPKVLICTKQPNFLLFKQPKSVNQFCMSIKAGSGSRECYD